jgi:hypothetical protein
MCAIGLENCMPNGDLSTFPLVQAVCASFNCPFKMIWNPSYEDFKGVCPGSWCIVTTNRVPHWESLTGKIELDTTVVWPAKKGSDSVDLSTSQEDTSWSFT